MIEIVFNDSACGSLKMAQNYGRGKYQSGGIGVFISQDDGRDPTEKEIEDFRREYAEKKRLAWESAIPLGGNSADIYGFNLALSVGNISEINLDSQRQEVLEQLCSIFPNDKVHQDAQELLKKTKTDLQTICDRVAAGEDIRIWYSDQPDDLCGVYWLMAQLNQIKERCGQVYLVELPKWGSNEKSNIIRKTSWSEVAPEEWHGYLQFQKVAPFKLYQSFASHWLTLQKENAPLRAVLNGQLVSVSENIYDSFIIREIAEVGDEFQEAMIIGRVLGKYQLGISDYWIALRIEEMIRDGKLVPVTNHEKDCPIYHRILKKINEV